MDKLDSLLIAFYRGIHENGELIVAIATVAIAAFTFTLWRATRKLWEAGERQIAVANRSAEAAEKALIAANRAWVKVDVGVGGPIFYNVNGVNFVFNFALSNIGRSPALNVWVNSRILAPEIGGDEVWIDPRAELRKMIEENRTKPVPPLGFALFPGESTVQQISMSIGDAELKRITQLVPFISPTVIGTVIYRFGIDEHVHQTGFSIEIRRSDQPRPESTTKNRSPSAIFIDEGDVPASEIRLFQSILDGGYAD